MYQHLTDTCIVYNVCAHAQQCRFKCRWRYAADLQCMVDMLSCSVDHSSVMSLMGFILHVGMNVLCISNFAMHLYRSLVVAIFRDCKEVCSQLVHHTKADGRVPRVQVCLLTGTFY